jgi:hypothetical protein
MNERIAKLAMQANSHHDNFFDLNYKELDVFLEKFAELIVQECAQQCWTVSELESKGFVVSECAKKIRKHFGVEE